MASTYVNDLRLNELGTGDGSGTWGTTTNTNFELIAEAFGFATEAITNNADTHTSTVPDGSSNSARNMYIKYTGALDSNCTITIGPNSISRVHLIENGTTDSGSSGPYSIIISQGSGANVTIPNGQVAMVYLDGAGSGAAVVNALTNPLLAGDITSSGTLGATGDTSSGDTAAIGFTSAEGIIITGQGSTNDVTIKNDADAEVIGIPTGTTNVNIVGVATAATFEPDGDTSSGDNAAIGFTAAEGIIITGQGSTNDVTIKNDADQDVLEIPTGTQNVTIQGKLTVAGDTAASDTAAIGFTSAEGLILTGQGSSNDVTIKNDADATVASIATGTTIFTIDDDIAVTGRAVGSQDADQASTGDGGTITMNLADHNNFEVSIGHTTTLTFSGQTVGQTGCIFLDKTSASAVSFNTIIAINASSQTALSTAGVYLLTYMVKAASGTGSILVSVSGALTADG